jgi:hypothetical protein
VERYTIGINDANELTCQLTWRLLEHAGFKVVRVDLLENRDSFTKMVDDLEECDLVLFDYLPQDECSSSVLRKFLLHLEEETCKKNPGEFPKIILTTVLEKIDDLPCCVDRIIQRPATYEEFIENIRATLD